jgi:hypothetical protein
MSQFTEWRDKRIASFQARRSEAILWFYVPAAASMLLAGLAFMLHWPWIGGVFSVVCVTALLLGDRHTRCPFCKKQAANYDDNAGFDPDVCPHCSMRLRLPSK